MIAYTLRMVRKVSARTLRFGMNLWPPFFGAGIRVQHITPDFRSATVDMRLRWSNRNYVGTHFGGSLYAMVDPFLMVMLFHNLGGEYHVWDKSGSIEYLAPGRGRVWARRHVKKLEQIGDDRGGDKLCTLYIESGAKHGRSLGGGHLHPAQRKPPNTEMHVRVSVNGHIRVPRIAGAARWRPEYTAAIRSDSSTFHGVSSMHDGDDLCPY